MKLNTSYFPHLAFYAGHSESLLYAAIELFEQIEVKLLFSAFVRVLHVRVVPCVILKPLQQLATYPWSGSLPCHDV